MYPNNLPCYLTIEFSDGNGNRTYKHFKQRLTFKQAKTGFNMLYKIVKKYAETMKHGAQININIIGYICKDDTGYYNFNNKMCYYFRRGCCVGGYYFTFKNNGTTNYKCFNKSEV